MITILCSKEHICILCFQSNVYNRGKETFPNSSLSSSFKEHFSRKNPSFSTIDFSSYSQVNRISSRIISSLLHFITNNGCLLFPTFSVPIKQSWILVRLRSNLSQPSQEVTQTLILNDMNISSFF